MGMITKIYCIPYTASQNGKECSHFLNQKGEFRVRKFCCSPFNANANRKIQCRRINPEFFVSGAGKLDKFFKHPYFDLAMS